MGRKAKPIEGVISDVRDVEPHKGQFRIRYKLNGVPSEAYRAKKEDAKSLYSDLNTRSILKEGAKTRIITHLSIEQVRQAEFAFEILSKAGVLDRGSDDNADLIATAARKYAEAVKRQGPAITVAQAYEQFIQHARAENRAKKTIQDYDRYVLNGFIPAHGGKFVYLLTPQDCHTFVNGFETSLDRFKSYGYLKAFLSFCAGKNNPAIDPLNGKPWIPQNPINFKKPVLQMKDIHSYELSEVKKILSAALAQEGKPKKSNRAKRDPYRSVGYLVFRLFSLCRFDEFQRFVTVGGGSSWTENKLIDLKNNRLNFNGQVFLKRGNGQERGRSVTIHPTFRAWIDYFVKNKTSFTYDRVSEEDARRDGCPEKFGDDFNNLLRHTAVTMHVKAFRNSSDTAYAAGTSTAKIDSNYFNARISEKEAKEFYKLTPKSLGL
jgi:hypothetical protein